MTCPSKDKGSVSLLESRRKKKSKKTEKISEAM